MKLTTTLLLILSAHVIYGQVLFNKTYNKANFDYADAVIERSDGKYLIVGSSRSQYITDYDVNILLVDSVGNLIWDKYIGQSPRLEFAYSLIETYDNNFLTIGRVGNSDPLMLKFDSFGTLIWEKEYPSAMWNDGISLGQNLDSNYYFISTDTATTLYLTDQVGDTLWTKLYSFAICRAVVQTSDGGYVMTGNNNLTTIDQDISLIKTNSTGDTTWVKTYGGPSMDDGFSIQQLSDDGYLIAGNYDTQIIDDEWETYIIRTNSFGDTLWTKNYYLGNANYIKEVQNGNGYILSSERELSGGFPNPDELYLVITRLDTLGNILWSRQFDGYTYSLGNNITETSDGGYLLTGHINNGTTTDIVLIKLDSLGNYVLTVNDILDSNASGVLVYPSPITTEVNFILRSSNEQITQFRLFNFVGQEVHMIDNVDKNQFRVDVSNLDGGIYFYELTVNKNKLETGKLIVID